MYSCIQYYIKPIASRVTVVTKCILFCMPNTLILYSAKFFVKIKTKFRVNVTWYLNAAYG